MALITSLSRDICNQRSYRSRRRREIFKLHKTICNLETKIGFHQSQVDYYDQYLKQCLSNLHVAKKKRVHFKIPGNSNQTLLGERSFKREILRYSASKLHNKGLLLSIGKCSTLIHFMTFLSTRWRFDINSKKGELYIENKNHEKIRETLFTYKLHNAELLSFC